MSDKADHAHAPVALHAGSAAAAGSDLRAEFFNPSFWLRSSKGNPYCWAAGHPVTLFRVRREDERGWRWKWSIGRSARQGPPLYSQRSYGAEDDARAAAFEALMTFLESQARRGDEMTNTDHDRVMRIIKARCGDVLTDDDIAALSQPADTLPLAAADEIIEVIEAMETRLEAMIARQSLPPPETLVEAFRMAMIDMTLPEKVAVVAQLSGWIEAERGSGEPLQ